MPRPPPPPVAGGGTRSGPPAGGRWRLRDPGCRAAWPAYAARILPELPPRAMARGCAPTSNGENEGVRREVVLIVTLVLATCCIRAEEPDLQPRHVRWQEYPIEVRSVTFDRTGRGWFALVSETSIERLKPEVESAVDSSTPAVRGAAIPLIDSHDRMW